MGLRTQCHWVCLDPQPEEQPHVLHHISSRVADARTDLTLSDSTLSKFHTNCTQCIRLYFARLKLSSKFAVFGLIAAMIAPSVMACLTPDTVLTPQEKACCRRMAGKCGKVNMSSSHSCCRSTVRENGPFLRVCVTNTALNFHVIGAFPKTPTLQRCYVERKRQGFESTHSPPSALQENVTTLRI